MFTHAHTANRHNSCLTLLAPLPVHALHPQDGKSNKRLVLAAESISLPSQDSTAEHSTLLLFAAAASLGLHVVLVILFIFVQRIAAKRLQLPLQLPHKPAPVDSISARR